MLFICELGLQMHGCTGHAVAVVAAFQVQCFADCNVFQADQAITLPLRQPEAEQIQHSLSHAWQCGVMLVALCVWPCGLESFGLSA